jgi:hypothetical protein
MPYCVHFHCASTPDTDSPLCLMLKKLFNFTHSMHLWMFNINRNYSLTISQLTFVMEMLCLLGCINKINNWPTRCDFVQFLFPANCSTCFRRHLHPSSEAQVNCNYSIWHWSNCMLPSAVVEESGSVPDAIITVYSRYWWWVKVSPETCRAVCRE